MWGTFGNIEIKDSQGNVLTKEQAEYFFDSKIVDAYGNLSVCSHFTENVFSKFDVSKVGSASGDTGYFGKGFYFTALGDFGKRYGSKEMRVYINIENPLCISELSYEDKVEFLMYLLEYADSEKAEIYIDPTEKIYGEDYITPELLTYDNIADGLLKDYSSAITDYAIDFGYDGVISNTRGNIAEIVAFYPEQIKSISNKNPKYSDDIYEDFGKYDEHKNTEKILKMIVFTLDNPSEKYDELSSFEDDEPYKIYHLADNRYIIFRILSPREYGITHSTLYDILERKGIYTTENSEDFSPYNVSYLPFLIKRIDFDDIAKENNSRAREKLFDLSQEFYNDFR